MNVSSYTTVKVHLSSELAWQLEQELRQKLETTEQKDIIIELGVSATADPDEAAHGEMWLRAVHEGTPFYKAYTA